MYTLKTAVQRAFDKCNLIGDDCDIYEVMYQYKAIRDLPDEEVEKVYDDIAARLGFMK